MTTKRERIKNQLNKNNSSESEQKMLKAVLERILYDMVDFYEKFATIEGPGVMVFSPENEDSSSPSMFYLNTKELMNALNDFSNRDMEGMADIMRKAIAKAEAIEDPSRHGLFIINDEEATSLYEYEKDKENKILLK